jgi:hypothetical protein
MTPTLKRYAELTDKLLTWRRQHPEDTPEEDAILDEMDVVWEALTPAEREEARRLPPNPPIG